MTSDPTYLYGTAAGKFASLGMRGLGYSTASAQGAEAGISLSIDYVLMAVAYGD